METQFRHANRDYIECRDLFEELEEAVGNGEAPTRVNQLQEAVSAKMTAVRQRVLEMQGTIMETPPSLRDAQSERKVGQLNEKLRMLESELGRFLGRQATDQREKREREYLLSGAERRDQTEALQLLGRESNSIQKSEAMIDQMMNQGRDTLHEMDGQRNRLKGAQRKLLDVMNTLGLSQSLMRVIERRQKFDAYIVYFGMLVVLAFLYLLYSWKYSTSAAVDAEVLPDAPQVVPGQPVN